MLKATNISSRNALKTIYVEGQLRHSFQFTVSTCLFLISMSAGWTVLAADPTTADCLSASEASLVLRNQHKLRDARAQIFVCSAASCPPDVRDECVRRAGEVNAAMPTIVFETTDVAGNDLVAVKVTMDGQPLADRLEGTAISLDPGEHIFTFESAAQPIVQKQLVIREGEKNRRERVTIGTASGEKNREERVTIGKTSGDKSNGMETQRVLAIAAAGVGVVGVVVGMGFGLDAMSKHDEASKACPNQCTDPNGVNLWNKAVSSGNVSTIGFVVGAAGLIGGAMLWFTAKPTSTEVHEQTVMQVGFGLGSVKLRGVW